MGTGWQHRRPGCGCQIWDRERCAQDLLHAAIQGSHPLHHAMSCQNGIMQGHSQEVAEYDVVIRSSTKNHLHLPRPSGLSSPSWCHGMMSLIAMACMGHPEGLQEYILVKAASHEHVPHI